MLNIRENAIDDVIVALDCDRDEALRLADALAGRARWMKVGMTLYYTTGPSIVHEFKDRGFKVFVDLKLNDIPHQVSGAAAALVKTGADMFTVHASGGAAMMSAAAESARRIAAENGTDEPISLGVTVLTSMDDETLASIGVASTAADQVQRLAGLVAQAGLTGVVCSPREASLMRGLLGPQAAVVTPGIRPAWAAAQDQKRIMTPVQAFEAGASHIVIGRPITQAEDPVAAFELIREELSS